MALASTSYRPAAARCVNTRRGSVVVRAQQRITAAPLRDAGLAFLASAALLACPPALADLNVYEAAAGGEFGIGSALQYGEADVSGRDFSNQVGGGSPGEGSPGIRKGKLHQQKHHGKHMHQHQPLAC